MLGIDNLVFISIAVSKLPYEQRERARKFGIAVACISRIALLLTLAWLAGLTEDIFTLFGIGISVRDLVLILGGAFLLVKGSMEIRDLLWRTQSAYSTHARDHVRLGDRADRVDRIVFSLDSVIAAGACQPDIVMVRRSCWRSR